MRKLTIGMATYNDYDGVYFTIQALRMYHSEVMDDVEFVIVNNSPDEKYHEALTDFSKQIKQPIKYIQFTDYSSTSIRNLVVDHANTPYVLVVDCHVLLEQGSIKKLIDYFDSGLDNGNLLQGPLLHDDLKSVYTSFNDVWGGGMQGKWHTDADYSTPDSPPFEIFAQGLGMFACRKDSWLRYNENFRGFGGEELYIHNKYRLNGKKAICIPFARWVHRFKRVTGTPYPNKWVDRYRNYLIGRLELGLAFDDVDEEFEKYISADKRQEIKRDVAELFRPRRLVSKDGERELVFVSGTGTMIHANSKPRTDNAVTEQPRKSCGCGK